MNKKDLLKLINTAEDDRHDFKEKWYKSDDDNSAKAEMLKDILSFVNITHDENGYLIFGVVDKTRKIIGVENDENRYNTQQITDWLSKLPIDPEVPKVKIDTVVLLSSGQVFTRKQDTNTSIIGTVD